MSLFDCYNAEAQASENNDNNCLKGCGVAQIGTVLAPVVEDLKSNLLSLGQKVIKEIKKSKGAGAKLKRKIKVMSGKGVNKKRRKRSKAVKSALKGGGIRRKKKQVKRKRQK
jgi:hypothetical protein